jgi:hypothetical protein
MPWTNATISHAPAALKPITATPISARIVLAPAARRGPLLKGIGHNERAETNRQQHP